METTIDGKPAIRATQNRFLSSGAVQAKDDETIWYVPLQIVTDQKSNEPTSDILQTRDQTLLVASNTQSGFYKLNYGHTGFYRTAYSTSALKQLGDAIKNGQLSTSDRIGLLNDVFALAQAGHASAVDGLTLLAAYEGETDYMYVVIDIIFWFRFFFIVLS